MIYNNKGQNLLFAIITAAMIFIFGMLTLNHLMGDVTLARTVGFDCSNSAISDGAKVTCLGVDIIIPIVLLSVVSLAIGAILSRFMI